MELYVHSTSPYKHVQRIVLKEWLGKSRRQLIGASCVKVVSVDASFRSSHLKTSTNFNVERVPIYQCSAVFCRNATIARNEAENELYSDGICTWVRQAS